MASREMHPLTDIECCVLIGGLKASRESVALLASQLAEERAKSEGMRGLLQECFRVTTYGHVHENHRGVELDERIRAALAEPEQKPGNTNRESTGASETQLDSP